MSHYYHSSPIVYRNIGATNSAYPPQPNYVKSPQTDRPMKDSIIVSNGIMPGNTPILQRDNSLKNVYDVYGGKIDHIISTPQTHVSSTQHQRTFSDYQLRLSGNRGEGTVKQVNSNDANLPRGGGLNISQNKLLQKSKNGSDSRGSAGNKMTESGYYETARLQKVKQTESFISLQRGEERNNKQLNCQYLNNEILRLSERLSRNQEKISRLERNSDRKSEDGLSASTQNSTYNTLQELKEIIGLVEETKGCQNKTREEYRKMNEQCRTTILQFRQELNKCTKRKDFDQLEKSFLENKATVQSKITEKIEKKMKKIEKDLEEHIKFCHDLSEKISKWQTITERGDNLTSSMKQFQGKMVSFIYEQRLILQNPNNSIVHSKPPIQNHQSSIVSGHTIQKENISNITLNSKTYFLDSQGFLLDRNKYYMLDKNNCQIQLTQKQLQLLRKHNILI